MTKQQFDRFIEKYNELDARCDKLYDKVEKAEKAGETDRAERLTARMDHLDSMLAGMVEALDIFGYELKFQSGKAVIVVKKGTAYYES